VLGVGVYRVELVGGARGIRRFSVVHRKENWGLKLFINSKIIS